MAEPGSRKEILRRDCPHCSGNGYRTQAAGEVPCERCGGTGMLEKEVPFKVERRSKEEIAEIWGLPGGESKPPEEE